MKKDTYHKGKEGDRKITFRLPEDEYMKLKMKILREKKNIQQTIYELVKDWMAK